MSFPVWFLVGTDFANVLGFFRLFVLFGYQKKGVEEKGLRNTPYRAYPSYSRESALFLLWKYHPYTLVISRDLMNSPLLCSCKEEHSDKGKLPPIVTDEMPVVDARAPRDDRVSRLEAAGETRTITRELGQNAAKDGMVGSSEGTHEAATGSSVVENEESERRYDGEGESDRRRAATNDAPDEKRRIERGRRHDAKCDRSDAVTDGKGKAGVHRDSDKPLTAPEPDPIQAVSGTAKRLSGDSLVVLNERQPTERVPKMAEEEAEVGRDGDRNGPRAGVPGEGSGVGGGPVPGTANGGGKSTPCPGGENGKPPIEKAVAIGSDNGEGDTEDLSLSGAGNGGGDGRPLLQQQQHEMGVSQSITDVESLPPPSLLRSTSKYLHEDLAEAKRKQNQ